FPLFLRNGVRDDAPAPVPLLGVDAVDALGGLVQAAGALLGQVVVTLTALAAAAQPALLDHAGYGGPHGAFGHAELGHEPQQAADPDVAAVVAHVLPEDGEQQRPGPHRDSPFGSRRATFYHARWSTTSGRRPRRRPAGGDPGGSSRRRGCR